MTQWFYVYRQWLLRELQLRFRSSAVGTGWMVLQPMVHILLFTLVFYQFFQVRWPQGDGSGVRVIAIVDPDQTFRFETGRKG